MALKCAEQANIKILTEALEKDPCRINPIRSVTICIMDEFTLMFAILEILILNNHNYFHSNSCSDIPVCQLTAVAAATFVT